MHIFYLVNSKKSKVNSSESFIKDDRKYNLEIDLKINNIENEISISNNNNNNNNSKNNNSIKIDQFSHQVGGHSAMLSVNGNICKPLINRELQFYEFSQLKNNIHSFFISPFLANFYGVVEVLKSKNDTDQSQNQQPPQQPLLTSPPKSQQPYMSNQQQINYSNIINNKNKKKVKECKHPSGTQQKYIVLSDLTSSYNSPCIVDIKIGTRQRGAICSSTTSTSHGIRVCGMKIYCPQLGEMITFDRYFGRTLDGNTLEESLFHFFTSNMFFNNNINNSIDNFNNNSNFISCDFHLQRINLIESILEKLGQIECILSNKNDPFPFKIYSSSLLIIYEGKSHEMLNQSLINNNNINSINSDCMNIGFSDIDSNSSSCATTPAQSPITNILDSNIQSSTDSYTNSSVENNNSNNNNINVNVSNSISIQRNINKSLESNSCISSNNNSMIEDMEDGFHSFGSEEEIDDSCVSSDLDSDSDEMPSNRSTRSNSGNFSGKSQPSKFIQNAVKMIDFAHAIPITEKEAQEDDGYLFGINNLQLLLFKIKSRLLFSLSVQKEFEQQQNQQQQQNQHQQNNSSELSSPSSSFSSLNNSMINNKNDDCGNLEFSFNKMFNHHQQNTVINTN
ncbi:hypothetical protein ACTFIV_005615 [Dictyostelium citrinum]